MLPFLRPPRGCGVVRTTRLELVDDDGKVQGVLEATAYGPRLGLGSEPGATLLRVEAHHSSGVLVELFAPDGTPRVQFFSDSDSGAVNVFGTEGHGEPTSEEQRGFSEPMASLRAVEQAASVYVKQVCDLGGEHYVGPAAELSARDPEDGGGGHLTICDAGPDLIHEIPETRAGFPVRLRARIVQAAAAAAAAADALDAEGWPVTPDELLRIYCEAAECAQGEVGQLAEERAVARC